MSVGIKLVVEVLDHYRGPDHKFRWLIAFAEKASDRTRTGWPSREVMARRTEKSPARVSNIGSELVADRILQRCGGGGNHRGNARYTLLAFAAQGSPSTNPETPRQGSPNANPKDELKGSPATHSQGSPSTNPDGDLHSLAFNPHTTLTPPGGAASAPTAQTILAAFIDWDRACGGQLTRSVTGQLAKNIARLLDEGIDDRYIRSGLAEWRGKGQHPATLDSFVSAAMNGRVTGHQKRVSTGDRAIAEAEELKAQLRKGKELA